MNYLLLLLDPDFWLALAGAVGLMAISIVLASWFVLRPAVMCWGLILLILRMKELEKRLK